jgi:ADP-heptose:LPS heptosyltransferase
MLAVLRRAYPGASITCLMAPRVAPLAACTDLVHEVLEDPGDTLGLAGRLRDGEFDLAIFPYAKPRLVLAAWLAGIPRRVGNGLRLYSPMLTDRVRVHRSKPPLHEAEYCLRLLDPLAVPEVRAPEEDVPALRPTPPQAGIRLMNRMDLEPGRFVLVHPGGGGSAGRPDPATFAALAVRARDAALPLCPLLVTCGPGEEELAAAVVAAAPGARALPPPRDLPELVALTSQAGLFLAGSTGPLHVAAATGAPTLGFYPWKASQTASRWAPLGPKAVTLSPPREGCGACEAGTCTAAACFGRIPPGAVEAAVQELERCPGTS